MKIKIEIIPVKNRDASFVFRVRIIEVEIGKFVEREITKENLEVFLEGLKAAFTLLNISVEIPNIKK